MLELWHILIDDHIILFFTYYFNKNFNSRLIFQQCTKILTYIVKN